MPQAAKKQPGMGVFVVFNFRESRRVGGGVSFCFFLSFALTRGETPLQSPAATFSHSSSSSSSTEVRGTKLIPIPFCGSE